MLFLRFILFTILTFGVFGDEPQSSEEITDDVQVLTSFMAALLRLSYEENKQTAIENLVNMFRDASTNITLIAYNNEKGKNGNEENANRIELIIPAATLKKESSKSAESSESSEGTNKASDDDDDDDEDKIINQIMSLANAIYENSGIELSILAITLDEDKTVTNEEYINREFTFEKEPGYSGFYNFSLVSNKSEISKILEQYKDSVVPPTVIHLDVDEKMIEETSNFPSVNAFITVSNASPDIPHNVVKTASHAYSKMAWQYTSEELPKQISLYLNRLIPEYAFVVLDKEAEYSIKPDYQLSLEYFNQDFDSITILALKK